MDPTPRRAARVLLVDAASRILMFRGFDPARPDFRYWVTPGGGLDDGESLVEAAARELAEETGLRVNPADLGESLWREVVEFPFDHRRYRQEQDFFLLRVASWEVSTAGFGEIERRTVDAHHWWSVDELATTTERIYPPDLVDRLRELLMDGAAWC